MTPLPLQNASLEELPRLMAEAIAPLYEAPSLARYLRYLDVMYHYTRNAEPELRYAAAIGPTPEVTQLFEELAAEEADHYRLAAHDARSLDHRIDERVPASVAAYRAYWNGTPAEEAYRLLGAMYVLENVAGWAGTRALASLAALDLRPPNCTFVAVHVREDGDHGRRLQAACREVPEEHRSTVLEGAREGARLWVDMHLSILAEPSDQS